MKPPLDTIICGDNRETMATFDADCIDLAVTSPPYDNLRTYGGHSWDFEGVAQQLWRIIKPGGVVVWIVGDATIDGSETGTSFRQALRFMEIGFRLHDTMIWDKMYPSIPTQDRYYAAWEFMFVLSRGKPDSLNFITSKNTNPGTKKKYESCIGKDNPCTTGKTRITAEESRLSNVWPIFPGGGKSLHRAAFPETLARDHIRSWSNEGDIVLDPFSGSGTTAKMARELGRHYVGIEINEEYCDIAKKRLAQKLLFGVPEGGDND